MIFFSLFIVQLVALRIIISISEPSSLSRWCFSAFLHSHQHHIGVLLLPLLIFVWVALFFLSSFFFFSCIMASAQHLFVIFFSMLILHCITCGCNARILAFSFLLYFLCYYQLRSCFAIVVLLSALWFSMLVLLCITCGSNAGIIAFSFSVHSCCYYQLRSCFCYHRSSVLWFVLCFVIIIASVLVIAYVDPLEPSFAS